MDNLDNCRIPDRASGKRVGKSKAGTGLNRRKYQKWQKGGPRARHERAHRQKSKKGGCQRRAIGGAVKAAAAGLTS